MAEGTENTLQVSSGDRYTIIREDGIVTEFIIATPAFGGWVNAVPDDPDAYFESSLLFDAGTGLLTTDLFGGQSPWTEVTTREDDADRPCERIETRANAEGEVGYRAVIADNGINSQVIGSGFGASATVRADTGDAKNWSLKFGRETESGAESMLTIFDDDRLQADVFGPDGQRQSREEVDIGDAYGWTERSTVWDADGNRDLSISLLDDGRVVTRDYEAGVLRTVFIEDGADVFAWATIERVYDETGTLVSVDRTPDPSDAADDLRAAYEELLADGDPAYLIPPAPPSEDYGTVFG
ncbi:MAG: hypothetical protein AAF366_10870 [Pseudomonadota bacterium]